MFVSATIRKVADMPGDNHGIKEMQVAQTAQDDGQQQVTQGQPQVSGTDWEKAVAERDEKIAALEVQVAEAAKNAETAVSAAQRDRRAQCAGQVRPH